MFGVTCRRAFFMPRCCAAVKLRISFLLFFQVARLGDNAPSRGFGVLACA